MPKIYIKLCQPGGMPEMIFEYVLKKNGIDPEKDVNMIQNIDFANTAGAFTGGSGDFTVEFEPNATSLENEGAGYVVASLGVESGYVPYTTYCAKKSYLTKNADIIEGFTRAIAKGQNYVANHSAEEIADIIAPQFKETSKEDLIKILNRYMEQDTYKETPVFDEDGYDLLQDILEEAGELKEKIDFNVLVDNTYAEKAVK
jgi:NitT/TauT family transport system substrate-binding protein